MRPLEEFLSGPGPMARLRLSRVRGSSPREAGCEMYVSEGALHGTIGGGQLEHRAIAAARALLARGDLAEVLDLPLGPEIGQCCGGRVEVSIFRMGATDRHAALARAAEEAAALPVVQIHGAAFFVIGLLIWAIRSWKPGQVEEREYKIQNVEAH